MLKKAIALLALGLLAGLVMTSSAEEKKDAKPAKDGEVPKVDTAAQENAEKVMTAFRLREWGKGKQLAKKGGQEPPAGMSIEALLTAAEMLYSMPPPKDLDPVKVEAGKEKDAPEGTDTKLSEAKKFDPKAEAAKILDEAGELVDKWVENADKKKFYKARIEEIRRGNRAVVGGPKAVQRAILPGQFHHYNFAWHAHLPGVVGFQSNVPMRLQVVQDAGGYIFADGITHLAEPHFLPGGPGYPAPNKVLTVSIRVINVSKTPGAYMLMAQ